MRAHKGQHCKVTSQMSGGVLAAGVLTQLATLPHRIRTSSRTVWALGALRLISIAITPNRNIWTTAPAAYLRTNVFKNVQQDFTERWCQRGQQLESTNRSTVPTGHAVIDDCFPLQWTEQSLNASLSTECPPPGTPEEIERMVIVVEAKMSHTAHAWCMRSTQKMRAGGRQEASAHQNAPLIP